MTLYVIDDPVLVFMPDVQHQVSGFVTATIPGCVHVSLDDRMCPVAVDPADHFRIQPYGPAGTGASPAWGGGM